MINKITLSGFAGSGKSTIAKAIAAKLNYDFISVGDFSRKFALDEYNMTINEFQEKCKIDPGLDIMIDNKFREFCNSHSNLIIDYRLGFHFIKNAYHILLKVSDNVAYQRINTANRSNEDATIEAIKKRNEVMRNRFLNLYQLDFTSESNYDLIIDTDLRNTEDITELILQSINKTA